MSFRYTNSLIGALRHRLLLEAAQRSIARQVFVGVCKGIEVRCSGFGGILSIQMRQGLTPAARSALDAYYYENANDGNSSASSMKTKILSLDASDTSSCTSSATAPPQRMLRLHRVQESVRAAVWMAQQQRRTAKADAIRRSVHGSSATMGNSFSSSSPSPSIGLQHWFEDHPDALAGLLPHQHITKWLATPWMTAIQYGLPSPERFLKRSTPLEEKMKDEKEKPPTGISDTSSTLLNVLSLSCCDPLGIPIGSVHPLHGPSLMQLEQYHSSPSNSSSTFSTEDDCFSSAPTLDSVSITDRALSHRSRVSMKAVRMKQRTEMCVDEIKFWERVELISGAQLATIKTGRSTSSSSRQSSRAKRPYKEIAQTVKDVVEEKIQLRFTT